jgi:hypothetical protein
MAAEHALIAEVLRQPPYLSLMTDQVVQLPKNDIIEIEMDGEQIQRPPNPQDAFMFHKLVLDPG